MKVPAPLPQQAQALRYSPLPMAEYVKPPSQLLDIPGAWNLAYLSFPYERGMPQDPMFTTHVRRTAQTRLGGGLGVHDDPSTLVGSLLSLPAPRFVHLVTTNRELLRDLPMVRVYGPAWLTQVITRSRLCAAENDPPADPDLRGYADAKLVIQDLMGR